MRPRIRPNGRSTILRGSLERSSNATLDHGQALLATILRGKFERTSDATLGQGQALPSPPTNWRSSSTPARSKITLEGETHVVPYKQALFLYVLAYAWGHWVQSKTFQAVDEVHLSRPGDLRKQLMKRIDDLGPFLERGRCGYRIGIKFMDW